LEFEVKLRNELTQKAIAKECAEWIRNKVKFKSNVTKARMNSFIVIEKETSNTVYSNIDGFTTVDLGCERGNNLTNFVIKLEAPESDAFLKDFEGIWKNEEFTQDVTEEVIEKISTAYKENSPEFIYFMTSYHVFSEFLEDISEDVLPNEATGFKKSKVWNLLYEFQRDAALAIINKL
jgi:hypothetical protein